MKILNKIISVVLIQMFFITGTSFASLDAVQRENLSPAIGIDSSSLNNAFHYWQHKVNDKRNQAHVLTADSLDQGYAQLSALVQDMAVQKNRPLVICIDGPGSAGKSTLFKKIKKHGLGRLGIDQIGFLSLYRLFLNMLWENEYSMFDVMLELPYKIAEKIESARWSKRIVIIDGMESISNLLSATNNKLIPDITVLIDVDEHVRIKRDLMRFGFFTGLKLLSSRKVRPKAPKGSATIKIKNNGKEIALLKFIAGSAVRTFTVFFEYVMPEAWVDSILSGRKKVKIKLDNYKQNIKNINLVEIVCWPLLFLAFMLKVSYDIFYMFCPEDDIIRLIKSKFNDKPIQLLDVGTGNGDFIEKFQKVLSINKIDGRIQGIDKKASNIVKALDKGLTVYCMGVEDLEQKYGEERFDVITVNAPDYPYLFVEQAMRVLKKDGILILRTAKHFVIQEEQEEITSQLRENFDVKVMKREMHNLPNGFFYKLYDPVVVMHKKQLIKDKQDGLELVRSAVDGNIPDFSNTRETQNRKDDFSARSEGVQKNKQVRFDAADFKLKSKNKWHFSQKSAILLQAI